MNAWGGLLTKTELYLHLEGLWRKALYMRVVQDFFIRLHTIPKIKLAFVHA